MQIPGYNSPYPYSGPYAGQANAYPMPYPGVPNSPYANPMQTPLGLPPGLPPGLMGDPNALLPLQNAYREAVQDIMKSPEKRREFMAIIQDMQSGKLNPQNMGERMSKLLDKGPKRPEDLPSPLQSLTVVGLATAAGVGLGALVRRTFSRLEQSRNSASETVIRVVDKLPGISALSRGLDNHMDRVAQASPISKGHTSLLLNLDGSYYSPADLRRQYVQRQFGKTGFQAEALSQLRVQLRPYLTSGKINAIINSFHRADRYSALQQIMQPELQHFIPDSLQHILPSLGDYKHLKLWQVDQHSAKNYFLRKLGEATYENHVDPKVARRLFEEIKKSSLPFADFYEKHILKKDNYSALMKTLFNSKKPPASYQALREQLGLKPFWTYLNEATSGLLYRGRQAVPLNALASSTLEDLEKRIVRTHIAGQLKLIPAWQAFEKKIRGVLLRTHGFETLSMPILESEYNLMRNLKNRGIGPAGRLVGKLWFNLNQMFSSSNFQRWSSQQARAGGASRMMMMNGSSMGRILLPLMIFGLAAQTGMKTFKENRKAKLADQLALGFGGFYGFTLAMSFLPRLPFPRALSFINRLNMTKLPGLPFTLGGVTQYMVIATILANYVSNAFQAPVNKIFGKPKKDDEAPNPGKDSTEKPSEASPLEALFNTNNNAVGANPNTLAGFSNPIYHQSYGQSYGQPYGRPSQASPQAPSSILPAASPLNALKKAAPLAAKAVENPKQAEQTATVLYSTNGLKADSILARSSRRNREDDTQKQFMNELRQIQRSLV